MSNKSKEILVAVEKLVCSDIAAGDVSADIIDTNVSAFHGAGV